MGFWKQIQSLFGRSDAGQREHAALLRALDVRLDAGFHQWGLLEQALSHKSYVNENPTLQLANNERLELLGDAVLDLVVTARLMRAFPTHDEGELSKLRSSLVNERILAQVAQRFGIGESVLLGKGERQSGGAQKPSLLANTYEAILGALFLDRGFAAVEAMVGRHFHEYFIVGGLHKVPTDFKTRLQEVVQGRFQIGPRYQLVGQSGPDHEKIFEVELRVREEVYGIGSGRSKKEAEQDAARVALERLEKLPEQR